MVYDEFTDEIFHKLSTRGCCIMGPQIVIAAAEKDPVSQYLTRLFPCFD